MKTFSKFSNIFLNFVIVLVALVAGIFPKQVVSIGSKVEYLPGFEGPLPFHLETGYIGVGESEEIQMFYYFVNSETNPKEHPLILWLSGERGCSSLTGLVYEIGPLYFEAKVYNGTLPKLLFNEYALTKNASIIFLDQLANIGFSYSTTRTTYTDVQATKYVYEFLQKWFSENKNFKSNPFFIASGSDGGLIVPTIVQHISNGNEVAEEPINLKGYILGNPKTYPEEKNFVVQFAYGMGLISTEHYQSLKESCKNEYMKVDPENELCHKNLEKFEELIYRVPKQNILEAYCGEEEPNNEPFVQRRALDEQFIIKSFDDQLFTNPYDFEENDDTIWCRVDYHLLSNYWANDRSVQKALHVRKVFKEKWVRCKWNKISKTYKTTIQDTRQQHALLSAKGYRSLIYSGDHDMIVPFQSTETWITSLNYSINGVWAPILANSVTAGFGRNYTNDMTFATIMTAGHVATAYKPIECAIVIARWISGQNIHK